MTEDSESTARPAGQDAGAPAPGTAGPGGSSGRATVEVLSCELPGCTNVMSWPGVGRKPKYCGQVVDGVEHNRLTAQRVREGRLTLPAPGSRPAAGGGRGGTGHPERAGDQVRPVSLARASLEALRDDITARLAEHQQWWAATLTRVETELSAATDLDAAATEVAAAHRAARGTVDAAEAERDDARARARDAEQAADRAEAARVDAAEAAEQALAERDDTTEQAGRERAEFEQRIGVLDGELAELRARLAETEQQRDDARQAHDDVSGRLTALTAQHQQTTAELDTARGDLNELHAVHEQTIADLGTARTDLDTARGERDTARTDAGEQRRRAETAEHDRDGARSTLAELRADYTRTQDQLTEARATAETRAGEAAQARTAHAVTAAELAALQRQLDRDIERERAHAAERLADLRARHADELAAARAQHTPTGSPTGTTAATETTDTTGATS